MATNNNADSKKIKSLEQQIKQLNDLVALLTKSSVENQNVSSNGTDRDITFISLCPNQLNLSTLPNGDGNIYTFERFGEEIEIPYWEAKGIVKNNKSFITAGKCYIADDEFVKSEHLQKNYEKLLSKEKLLELFDMDRNTFKSVFASVPKEQQEIFKDMLFEKLTEDKNSVDMNIVQIVNDTLNVDILKSVELSKELLKNKEE